MEKLNRIIKSLLLAGVSLLLLACPVEVEEPSLELLSIGWVYENLPLDWWESPPIEDATLSVDFLLVLRPTSVSIQDISKVVVTHPAKGIGWNVDDPYRYEVSDGRFVVDLRLHRGDDFEIPSGTYQFEVVYSGGLTLNASKTIAPPGSTDTSGTVDIYNEEFLVANSVGTGMIQMIPRATVGTSTNNGTTISIEFTVNSPDIEVYSGWVDFYSTAGNRIASSPDFVNYANGSRTNTLNGGANLNDGGTNNTLTLTSTTLEGLGSNQVSDIVKFRIFLTDGAQYVGTSSTFDAISISALQDF